MSAERHERDVVKTTKGPLFQEVAAVDPRLQRLLDICGIQELPRPHTREVALERVVIANEALLKPPASLVRSIKLLGIRQPPSVAFRGGSAWDAEDAVYEVMMGRRRIASARLLATRGDPRFKVIKCEVYEVFHPRLAAFLALVENGLRSDSWRQDVLHLRQLVQDGLAMTLDDLAASGFHRRTIQARLHLALLPEAIALQMLSDPQITQEVALQILRLKEAERAHLEALCQKGTPLTPSLVRGLLKRQIDRKLATLPGDLTDYWRTPTPSPGQVEGDLSAGSPPAVHLLSILRQAEPGLQADPALHQVALLTRVLISELAIVARSTPSTGGGVSPHV